MGSWPRPELVYLNGKRPGDMEGESPGSGQNPGKIRRGIPGGCLAYLNGVEAQRARERPPAGWIHPARRLARPELVYLNGKRREDLEGEYRPRSGADPRRGVLFTSTALRIQRARAGSL